MKLRTLACLAAACSLVALAACGSSDNTGPTATGQDAGFDSNTSSSGTSGTSGADSSSGSDGSSGGTDAGQDVGVDAKEAGYTGPAHFLYAIGKSLDTTADGGPISGIIGYTLDPTNGDLASFDTDGVTAGFQESIAAGANPVVGAATPNGSFIYVANNAAAAILSYSVDAKSGALTPLGSTSNGTGSAPSFLIVDAAGKHLYVSKRAGASIATFDIGTTGVLTPSATTPESATVNAPRGMVLSLAGDFLFVANEQEQVSTFKVDPTTGALSGRVDISAPGSPIGILHHRTKKVIYVTAANGQGVYTFSYDATGALTALGAVKTTGTTPIGAAIDLAGAYLYVANAGDATISAFPIDPTTGALGTLVSSSLGAGQTGSRGITVDPAGKYLVVSGDLNLVTVLAIGTAGAVTPLPNAIKGKPGSYSYYDPLIIAH